MRTLIAAALATVVLAPSAAPAQRAGEAGRALRIALAKQPFSPTGTSPGRPRWPAAGSSRRWPSSAR
jgi:hypothetical protein